MPASLILSPAQSIDIEIARYDGTISASNTSSFTYTRNFRAATDDYIVTLPYISSNTANGNDPQSGSAISGFKWWNFGSRPWLTVARTLCATSPGPQVEP
jgi:hypothetical protein